MQRFRGIVSKFVRDNRLFSEQTFNVAGKQKSDLQIAFELKKEAKGSLFSVMLTTITVAIIPTTVSVEYGLSAQVVNKRTNKVYTCVIKDSMRMWGSLVFLPLGTWKAPEKIEARILDNMLESAFDKMSDEGLFDH